MQIQLDIPDQLNKKLKIEKIHRGHQRLQQTVIELLKEKLK